MNKRELGTQYEQITAEYLKQQGVQVLEQNFRCRHGEIDLIIKDGAYLAFVEVKYRSTLKHGDPAEAVTSVKQERIRMAARYYLYQNRYGEDTPCRFDVIRILKDKIDWIKNAF